MQTNVFISGTSRYVANFMHRTGLLQQFQHVGIEEDDDDDDEPTGLAAMELGVEDDGENSARVDKHAKQLATITRPSIETETGEGAGRSGREREGERK
ncbi:hypothetical protein N7457_000856 [Penicillium paradoxum]|uniref:uncharacterized protein n=1 Tax=Penicillium paradoxum TaxID=176176 RepID=UPI0025481F01|nr:uncharacterized protein N7457_000856 [Penicillium paradoxum]KAJ5794257.1 hypothetical protein N7457_000856 [Penicillium paradoxum]